MASQTDISRIFKGTKGPLRHRCAHCGSTASKLLRCTGCHGVRYCCRDHQVAHRAEHKSGCNKIKKARTKLAKEDYAVRNAAPDFMTPANAFETHVGHFWGLIDTRDYMRARLALAKLLVELNTLNGVSEAYHHMRDMMRLCRSDNLGLRQFVPSIMLRLDLDQECYDFVKWWATCDPDGRYDWGNMDLPYLDIHGANVMEDPTFLTKAEYPDFSHVIAVLVLKLKMLVDIRNLKVARKVFAHKLLIPELHEPIERSVIRSPLSIRFQSLKYGDLIRSETKLRQHICQLGAKITHINSNFFFSLFDPDESLVATPAYTSSGSSSEADLALQQSYAAFWETGVLDLLVDARACAARDSENEIEDMMEDETSRTAEELLEDVSVNRVWGYLDYAVENASYLGPPEDRPSERHTRANRAAWAEALAEGEEDDDDADDPEWSDDEE